MGRRPVQFGIAVRRNPAIAAGTNPNSISWMCQPSGSNRLGNVIPARKRDDPYQQGNDGPKGSREEERSKRQH